ncbi:MAG: TIGR03546 family protein [Planctomycetes bacterium]|nr:TIGR03546 family protein [Planctomycetota bacterium]
MLTLKILRKLFKILNGDVSPRQVAGGFAFGVILGLTPLLNLHNLLVLFLICIIRVNVSSAIFSMLIFKLLAFLIDPLSHQLGYLLLVDFGFLNSFWTFLYNLPIVPWTNFNNTLVLGSLVISLILFVPNLVFVSKGVVSYRNNLKPKLEKTKFFRALQATKIYTWYHKIISFGSTE